METIFSSEKPKLNTLFIHFCLTVAALALNSIDFLKNSCLKIRTVFNNKTLVTAVH